MASHSIHIRALSKAYRIGHHREKTLSSSLGGGLKGLLRRKTDYETFWALRGLSMDIEEGQVVGIIGSNGAGKTTLLKLLSRITYPTEGAFEIHGRVASLLEVGTGFHPELSGRENIFLNGTILGLSRLEVRAKFDEIVEFSGVEHFLDTPVKRYSSGMFVRLAFSVAAHLDPEVLIVDEVLAVGDASFQRKCLGKMGEVAREGRTVLFVSHNMGAVGQLCNRTIWLDGGHLKEDGNTDTVIRSYLSQQLAPDHSMSRRTGNGKAQIKDITLGNAQGKEAGSFRMGEDLILNLNIFFNENIDDLVLGMSIMDSSGNRLAHILNLDEGFPIHGQKGETKQIRIQFPEVFLAPGDYHFAIGLEKYAEVYDELSHAVSFNIVQGNGIGRTTPFPGSAKFYLPSKWKAL